LVIKTSQNVLLDQSGCSKFYQQALNYLTHFLASEADLTQILFTSGIEPICLVTICNLTRVFDQND